MRTAQQGCSLVLLFAIIFTFFMLGAGLAGVEAVEVTPKGIQMIMPDGKPAVPHNK
jgi:hypothetical protein